MGQDKGASADADRAVVNGAASVSAVPASIPCTVKGAFREALGYIWRDFDERMARDFIEALHSRGFAVVEMNAAPRVEVSSRSGGYQCREVRARVTIEAGLLGGQQMVPEYQWERDDFRRDYLPGLLARTIAGVIEGQIRPRIAQAIEARQR